MDRRLAPAAFLLLSIGCSGLGDNTAARNFYATVRIGDSLPEVIAAGEKAQAYDIEYWVMGLGCPGDDLEVKRHNDGPAIRISQQPADPSKTFERSYNEIGYASREDFARGLAEIVPKFYSCLEFRFTFGRFQGWPNSDSFRVKVDASGKITSRSPLTLDSVD